MSLFDNLSQLSNRGLLNVPNPEPKYQIVQFPKDFIKVGDTERVFGSSIASTEQDVSIHQTIICKMNRIQCIHIKLIFELYFSSQISQFKIF